MGKSTKKKESVEPLEGAETKKRGRSPTKKDASSESSSKKSSSPKKKVAAAMDKRVTRSQSRSKSPKKAKKESSPKKKVEKKASKSPVTRASKSKSPKKKIPPKKKPRHGITVHRTTKPTYNIMIAKAIHELGELRNGSSSIAIGKYIQRTYPVPKDFTRHLRVALKKSGK